MADLVPAMLSNTTPSGVVSSYGMSYSGSAFQAFDDDLSSSAPFTYFPPTYHSYLSYQFTAGHIVEWYSVKHLNITGWLLQGSNDGSAWTTLDTQSGLSGSTTTTETFITNTTSYTYYRLYDIAGSGTGYVYEVQYWTGPHTSIVPDPVDRTPVVNEPLVLMGALPAQGVSARPMPTFRPELINVGVGILSGTTPAVANPTLDLTPLIEGLVWDATTRGGLGGASMYMRQPIGSRSTRQSTNLCPDPLGTATTWWPS